MENNMSERQDSIAAREDGFLTRCSFRFSKASDSHNEPPSQYCRINSFNLSYVGSTPSLILEECNETACSLVKIRLLLENVFDFLHKTNPKLYEELWNQLSPESENSEEQILEKYYKEALQSITELYK